MGPWRAAQHFVDGLKRQDLLEKVEQVKVLLYGSLAKTGKGHGTDVAIMLGMSGADPVTFDVNSVASTVEEIKTLGQLKLAGRHKVPRVSFLRCFTIISPRPSLRAS